MELRQLEYFMITCEKGSFNQAAECLYTTQPNVSKVISSLEKNWDGLFLSAAAGGSTLPPMVKRSVNMPRISCTI